MTEGTEAGTRGRDGIRLAACHAVPTSRRPPSNQTIHDRWIRGYATLGIVYPGAGRWIGASGLEDRIIRLGLPAVQQRALTLAFIGKLQVGGRSRHHLVRPHQCYSLTNIATLALTFDLVLRHHHIDRVRADLQLQFPFGHFKCALLAEHVVCGDCLGVRHWYGHRARPGDVPEHEHLVIELVVG